MKQPAYLKHGDTIGLVAPARKVSAEEMEPAIGKMEEWGFRVICGEHLYGERDQYSGTDEERTADFQSMLDNPDVKAVFCGRGGYGTLRIIDKLDFSAFEKSPKWICGYSDITVLHAHIHQCLRTETIHSAMPINFPGAGKRNNALQSLKGALTGEKTAYTLKGHPLNRGGEARGILVGGNLSLLYALQGSPSFPDLTDKILFIEDLDEYLYHIDRMMLSMKRAGSLEKLAGLVIGGMTDMKDNAIPFGKNAEAIVRDTAEEYGFPLCFGFPAGHIPDNRALIFGRMVTLQCDKDQTTLTFSDGKAQ